MSDQTAVGSGTSIDRRIFLKSSAAGATVLGFAGCLTSGPYSLTLNAIEPLWKSLKREISPEIYEDEEHFREFLTETFLRLSHRLSFAVDWIDTFLPDVQKLR